MKHREPDCLRMRTRAVPPAVELEETQVKMNSWSRILSKHSIKSSLITHHKRYPCKEHTKSFFRSCQTVPTMMSSDKKLMKDMVINLKRLLPLKHMQDPEEKDNWGPETQSLIRRMGLKDQLLMVQLRLPFKTAMNSCRKSQGKPFKAKTLLMEDSKGLVMRKTSTRQNMPGTGSSLMPGPPGMKLK